MFYYVNWNLISVIICLGQTSLFLCFTGEPLTNEEEKLIEVYFFDTLSGYVYVFHDLFLSKLLSNLHLPF